MSESEVSSELDKNTSNSQEERGPLSYLHDRLENGKAEQVVETVEGLLNGDSTEETPERDPEMVDMENFRDLLENLDSGEAPFIVYHRPETSGKVAVEPAEETDYAERFILFKSSGDGYEVLMEIYSDSDYMDPHELYSLREEIEDF